MKNIILLAALAAMLSGCATTSSPDVINRPPPAVKLQDMDKAVLKLDSSLKAAKTKAERISILVDALSYKDVVTPEKK